MFRYTTLLFTLIIMAQQASATDSWEQSFGPEGNHVSELSGTSAKLFAKAGSWYSSSDAGDSWEIINWTTVPAARVIKRSGTVFWMLDADGTPYKSTDGVNWEEKSTGMTLPSYASNLSVQGDLIFVNTFSYDKTWISTNGGNTWTLLGGSGISKPPRFVHQSGSNYVGWAFVDGLWYSEDQGSSWERCQMDYEVSYVYDFLETSAGLLVSTAKGIYLSTDNGISFTHADSVKANAMLLVGSEVLIATNNGAFWHNLDGSYLRDVSSTLNPPRIDDLERASGLLLAATNAGVYRSADQGNTWSPANKGLGFSDIYSIDGQGDTLWLASGNGIWRSTTQAQRWAPVSDLPASRMHDVWVSGDSVIATGVREIWISINKGQSWEPLASLPEDASGAYSATACNGVLFAGASTGTGEGIYRYSSGSWSLVRSESAQRIWCYDGKVYGGRSVSSDLGDSWTSFGGVGGQGNIYSYGALDGKVYLGSYPLGLDPVYRSSNGTSFSSFDNGLGSVATIYGITNYKDSLYIMADDGDDIGVYKIWGSETSWTRLGETFVGNNDLGDIHHTPTGLIVGSNNNHGVYRFDYSEPEPPDEGQDSIDYPEVPTDTRISLNPSQQKGFQVFQNQQSIRILLPESGLSAAYSLDFLDAQGKSMNATAYADQGAAPNEISLQKAQLKPGIYFLIIRDSHHHSVMFSRTISVLN